MSQMNNGRIDTLNSANYNIYDLYREEHKRDVRFNEEAIRGTHTNNALSEIFFSGTNIDVLQSAIRYEVYKISCKKHIIDRQSDTDLKVIMRATYLEHAKFGGKDVLKEVKRLNGLVLDFCVPRIIQEINMYMRYRSDINQLPIPLDRGEFATNKGQKTLEIKNL
jgi:hypothetical protein